jgi:hypothetical protein
LVFELVKRFKKLISKGSFCWGQNSYQTATNVIKHKMTDRFLNAKHWQIFLLTVGIPIIFQIILIATIVFNLATKANPNPETILNYVKFFPIFIILPMAFFF